jgi:cytochrome c556
MTIRTLLETVIESDSLPTDSELQSEIQYGAYSERTAARKGVLAAARRIRKLSRGELDHDAASVEAAIAEIIDDTADKYALHAADRHGEEATGRDAVPDILRARGSSSDAVERRREQVIARRKATEPLQELLNHAGRTGGVRAADLDTLTYRDDLTPEQLAQFRDRARAAGKRVATAYRSGAQGNARVIAQRAAEELSDFLAEPAKADPLADVDDPAAIAAAISARSRSGAA